MNRSLAPTLALLLLLPPLLEGGEPLYGLMVYPPNPSQVSEVSEDATGLDVHTPRVEAITVEEAEAEVAAAGTEVRSDDLLAALNNAQDLGPLLAGFDPPAPLEDRPGRHARRDRADPHGYVAVDARHGFAQGGHQGTRVGADGRLELAPGARQGAFVSRAFQVQGGFDYLQAGLAGSRGAHVFVRAYQRPGGPPSSWRRVRREKEIRMQTVAAVLQVLVLLLATANQPSPGLGRVTFTPARIGGGYGGSSSIYGIPGYGMPGSGYSGGWGSGYGSNGGYGSSPIPSNVPSWTQPSQPAPSLPPVSGGGLRIVSRSEWGAASPTSQIGGHRPSSITIHHTEGPASQYAGARTVQEVQRFHQRTRGWSDVGYHFLIGPDGTVFEGRPLGQVGAHSPPNPGRVGVCFIGNYMNERPGQAALASAQALIQALVQRGGVQRGALEGHRDQRSTDCPGDHLYPYVPQFRSSM